MKNRHQWIFNVLMLLSLLLSACASQAALQAVPATQPPAVTQDTLADPNEDPQPAAPASATAILPATGDQLNQAFKTSLANMKVYNTIKMDTFAEVMLETRKPFLLDVRQPEELEKNGYIEGAVLIPLRELGDNLDKLPSFDTPIVTYCGSGWRCTIAATALPALGWQDVTCLKDNSFGGWVEAGYPVIEGLPAQAESLNAASPDLSMVQSIRTMLAAIPQGFGSITADQLATELAEKPDLFLVDVRTPPELEEKGAIAGAVSIPLQDFIAGMGELPAAKDAPIAVYCGSGHRSTMAMTILWAYGYTDVRSLKGGLAAWQEAGYPVEGGQPASPQSADLDQAYQAFLDDMAKYNTIGLDELNTQLAEGPAPFLLDVRSPEEAQESGYIEGAVLIPLRELAKNLDKLPSFDTPIVSYCGSGWRCTIASSALESLGWQDVKCLKGGSYSGWLEEGYATVPGVPEQPAALNAANPDPVMVALFDEVLSTIPQGFGGVSAEALAAEMLENPDLVLIDVRTPGELEEQGLIEFENLIAIPLEELVAMEGELPANLDAPIVVYCGSGHRSTLAMTLLWGYGYSDVRSLKGGFGAWSEAGFPVAELVAQ
jgi:rhodanese-related sulfurtransferase